MANVRLMRVEAERGLLPPVCMECGQPATENVAKKFTWHPSWTIFLLILWVLPGLIIMMLIEQKCLVRAPFCEEHVSHWRRRNRIILSGFIILILLLFAVVSLAFIPDNKAALDSVMGAACFGWVGIAVVWLIVSVIVQSRAISATKITEESIYLKNVSLEFVGSLEGTRTADPDRFRLQMQTRAQSSASSGCVIAAVLVAVMAIIVLVAIGNIGKEARVRSLQPMPAPRGGQEVVVLEHQIRLHHPGPGWELLPPKQLEEIDEQAVAGADNENGILGLILVEPLDANVKIDGNEEKITRKLIKDADLKNVRIVHDVKTIDFHDRKAFRYQIVGTDEDGDRVRLQNTVLFWKGRMYQVLLTGPENDTAEDGSSFRPFEDAFEPVWNDPAPNPPPAGAATAPKK
jgi:hypothetical protein